MSNEIYDSPNVRKGRFLWMKPEDQKQYVHLLKLKIANGYYYSDVILSKIADELTPVLSDIPDD